ncbi:putative transmembrane protein [Rhodopirellula islandica]|uniref:Transmembrane protein n=1 Tax=Rhodopirellula islandica TaxID=595434 RepID=A0A0J1BEQ3_RHOIS|nr:putative transmembrane protein [Rhodopirellula islandica]
MSTATAVVCFASMLFFEAVPTNKPLVFGVHVLVFLVCGTLWFHLWGRPTLKTWMGSASKTALARERARFQDEKDQA